MTNTIVSFFKLGNCEGFSELKILAIKELDACYTVDAGFEGEGHARWSAYTVYPSTKHSGIFGFVDTCINRLGVDAVVARLMTLGPYGVIKKHSDAFLQNNIARLHIPILTNKCARLFIDGHLVPWSEGEIWYGDFRKEHWGDNYGEEKRIHLVIDVEVNEKLKSLLGVHRYGNLFAQCKASVKSINELRCYQSKFIIPSGLRISGLFEEPTTREIVATIQLNNNGLTLFLDGSPFLPVSPVSETIVAVEGLPIKINLEYDFVGREGTAVLHINDNEAVSIFSDRV